MDALDILRDLTSRPRAAAAALRSQLNPVSLNARPGGHDNSVAWLLWHTGREIDVQLADLTGDEQLWTAGGFAARFALGEVGDSVGYGHTSAEARRILVEDGEGLLEYVDAALAALERHLEMVTVADLEDVIDAQWDPPVTRGARLVSIVDDAVQHLAQAAYVLGMPLRE
ncbi:DinB family protein [Brachybacterium vulturis]|uniref:mycothiol transferase n=1 Tax=Brachybacterium vulturis TaxID=2017484 RepID=UPI003736D485